MSQTLPGQRILIALVLLGVASMAQSGESQSSAKPSVQDVKQSKQKLPDYFLKVLGAIKDRSKIPILLPDRLPGKLPEKKIFARADADENSYKIHLESSPGCDGANACFLGYLSAERSEKAKLEENTRLVNDLGAEFTALSCGGSCSPPQIEWSLNGVLYRIQLNISEGGDSKDKEALVSVANSALSSGPR